VSALARWYATHGRHELAWRATRDPWAVLVSEVMLAQTQVSRVADAWPRFLAQFPTPAAAAAAGPGALIEAWGRLGYPRRARRLWESAVVVHEQGWPDDLRTLPGVGRYTAGALRAQCDDDPDAIGIDVNIKRVLQRVGGDVLGDTAAELAAVAVAAPLQGRDRLLALMDLGALMCTPRAPACPTCPLHIDCATRGPLEGEVRTRQAPYKGSLRERRGTILARLRAGERVASADCDGEALDSLLVDQLVDVRRGRVVLPDR
jgi:A/G-specific adenine glycosylase